jgi:predicted O-methyltransferase YrrM
VQHLAPQRALELGTNLGLSGLYQAAALLAGAEFTTVEGSPALAALARENFQSFGYNDVLVHAARFDDALLALPGPWDWVLLDGHHTAAATARYADAILPRLAPGGVFVLDDIRWTPDMYRAWQALRRHPFVGVSVELSSLGLVFVGRAQAPEHFILRDWGGGA